MDTLNQTSAERLQAREAALFDQRDKAEQIVREIAGKLTPLDFLLIRQAVASYEDAEERIGKLQERMNDLAEWVE